MGHPLCESCFDPKGNLCVWVGVWVGRPTAEQQKSPSPAGGDRRACAAGLAEAFSP